MYLPIHSRKVLPLLLLLLAGGCAHYEYDVIEPANLAGHIGEKPPYVMQIDPLHYEARAMSDRLVLVINNPTDEPVKLVGEDSFAVDPRGESHPLPNRTIAPNSSTKLIFPPVKPTFRQSGPVFGVGVGVGLGSAYRRSYYGHHGMVGGSYMYDDYPRYYRLEDDGTVYWDWTGDKTDVKLRLVFQKGAERFHHDFTFERVKR